MFSMICKVDKSGNENQNIYKHKSLFLKRDL